MPHGDLSIFDSSLESYYRHANNFFTEDPSIRVGIVRDIIETVDKQTRYVVEMRIDGIQTPVICALMSRFGGVHNFEEFRVRPWARKISTTLLPPVSAGPLQKRSGDVVLVAFIDGNKREGVILGGINHPARVASKEATNKDKIEYISTFNGLTQEIRDDGTYKVTYNGKAVNDATLDLPPLGTDPLAPIYNPIVSGSFFGFDKDGSFIATDNRVQLIKLEKSLVNGNLIIKSGQAKIELSGTLGTGDINAKAQNINLEGQLATSIKSTVSHSVESLQVSIKGVQMAIGSDQFELFQGLSDLIDALGTVTVTSPVGTCTPLSAAPTWAAKVLPLQILIKTMITSLKSAKSASFSGDDSPDSIGDDVGS